MGVHVRELELVLEVRNGAQPTHDDAGILRAGVIYGQPGKTVNADVRLGRHRHDLAGQTDTLLGGKERSGFLLSFINRHDDLIEQPRGAASDVDMAQGDGIKAPGVDRSSRVHAIPTLSSVVDPASTSTSATCR